MAEQGKKEGGLFSKVLKVFWEPPKKSEEQVRAVEQPGATDHFSAPVINEARITGMAIPEYEQRLADALSRTTKKGVEEFIGLLKTAEKVVGTDAAFKLATDQAASVLNLNPKQIRDAIGEKLDILDLERKTFEKDLEDGAKSYVAEREQKITSSEGKMVDIREQISKLEKEASEILAVIETAKQELSGVEERKQKRRADFMVSFDNSLGRFKILYDQLEKIN